MLNIKIETVVGAFMLLALALFVYMSFQLGSVRLNLARYASYSIGFKDVSNLLPKADIKIAGVKVGWVDSVFLDPQDMQVKVTLKILKEYRMYGNASAVVRQEGMLGVKYLEVLPGTQDCERIMPGNKLPYQSRPAVGIDEIFTSVNTLAKQIERLGTSLEESNQEARALLQSIRERLSKIDKVFTDLGSASESFQETAAVVKKASRQLSDLLPDDGSSPTVPEGSPQKKTSGIARLLTDDSLYADIKETSDFARNCVERVQQFWVGLDSHLEWLPHSNHTQAVGSCSRQNVKWYFDSYVGTCDGLFGKLGLTYSNKGFARRTVLVNNAGVTPLILGHRNAIRLNLQVGAYRHPYGAVRVGIFEGTAGVGVDWWFAYDRFRWLSTFEAFDFWGYNRFENDRRPHLKWLNRLFVSPHVYLTFGADDFISRCNRSGFVGIGAYFSLPSFFECCD